MTRFVAFLRGVNLGRRTVRSAELQQAFADMGFAGAKTLLASGNVAFSTDADADADADVDVDVDASLAARLEAGLQQAFGFPIGTVLRRHEQLQAMVAAQPFGDSLEHHDLKLYVTLLAEPRAHLLTLPCGIAGDFQVVRVTDREIYHEAYRQPNGRYGAGATLIGKPFGKTILWTNRNWNTIVKAAAA
jgi:uncharacterized protein (DUF1697 family)